MRMAKEDDNQQYSILIFVGKWTKFPTTKIFKSASHNIYKYHITIWSVTTSVEQQMNLLTLKPNYRRCCARREEKPKPISRHQELLSRVLTNILALFFLFLIFILLPILLLPPLFVLYVTSMVFASRYITTKDKSIWHYRRERSEECWGLCQV